MTIRILSLHLTKRQGIDYESPSWRLADAPPMATEPLHPDGTVDHSPLLVRSLGLGSLVIFGIGDMLGAGIYALIGRAAGILGNAIWLAFLASMVAALLTGMSYASLGSRYPRAAGAAYVTHRAFRLPMLSYIVGLAVTASGLTSMAAASRAFAGYISQLVGPLPAEVTIVGFILILTLINFWGMRESTWVNAVCTTVEVAGLLFVIAIGIRYWGGVRYLDTPQADGVTVTLVLQGAVLTFYSFIGFEDLLNVAEEVRDVRRTLPRALLLAMAAVTLIYIAVSITAVSVVPWAELARSPGPLVEVVRRAAPWCPPSVFAAVGLFAIANTALLNYIMGSRLVYGLARHGFVPKALGRVHASRRTPHIAILALMVIVLILAFWGDISSLAKATSVLLLIVFIIVNGALIVLRFRPDEPRGAFEIPSVIPLGGIIVCGLLVGHSQRQELWIAISLLIGIAVLYLILRPRNIEEME